MTRVDRQDCLLLVVQGDIDQSVEGQLLAAACSALKELSGRPLVMDLSGLGFAGSVGMSDLLMIDHEVRTHGHHVRIVLGDNQRVRNVVAALGLHQRLTIVDSGDDTLRRSRPVH